MLKKTRKNQIFYFLHSVLRYQIFIFYSSNFKGVLGLIFSGVSFDFRYIPKLYNVFSKRYNFWRSVFLYLNFFTHFKIILFSLHLNFFQVKFFFFDRLILLCVFSMIFFCISSTFKNFFGCFSKACIFSWAFRQTILFEVFFFFLIDRIFMCFSEVKFFFRMKFSGFFYIFSVDFV